jgi:hypothetical protein
MLREVLPELIEGGHRGDPGRWLGEYTRGNSFAKPPAYESLIGFEREQEYIDRFVVARAISDHPAGRQLTSPDLETNNLVLHANQSFAFRA